MVSAEEGVDVGAGDGAAILSFDDVARESSESDLAAGGLVGQGFDEAGFLVWGEQGPVSAAAALAV